jgi:3-oxoacyl-[acyl-carrier-protein] synthase II
MVSHHRQVCISGLGIVSPLGNSITEFSARLKRGQSGIVVLDNQPEGRNIRVAGKVNIDFKDYIAPPRIPSLDRVALHALSAAKQAVEDAHAHQANAPSLNQAGVYIGSGIGGIHTLEAAMGEHFLRNGARMKPLTVVQSMNNAAAGHIAMEYGCHGPSLTYSTACSSSAMALGEAYRAIKHGYIDIAIAGGAEAMLTPSSMDAWEALRTLAIADATDAATSCKPFSKDRTGLVLAEGAAIFILEELTSALQRGARIYAILAGYGSRTDATHITKPDAAGQVATMRQALDDAALSPADIGYLNAHGTATVAGDVVETNAIKEVFGAHTKLAVSSTKSMHGHVMGATGAVEFLASVIALNESFLPPTINLSIPDPECDLDYVPNTARLNTPLKHVMSNSFAFGGSNACLIASHPNTIASS